MLLQSVSVVAYQAREPHRRAQPRAVGVSHPVCYAANKLPASDIVVPVLESRMLGSFVPCFYLHSRKSQNRAKNHGIIGRSANAKECKKHFRGQLWLHQRKDNGASCGLPPLGVQWLVSKAFYQQPENIDILIP